MVALLAFAGRCPLPSLRERNAIAFRLRGGLGGDNYLGRSLTIALAGGEES
ncbi:MAG: hypothetical protein PCALPYG88_5760 [uncultured Paraburkholderia sp.]|uniref:hypothetical protein n=1 Tax=uncultured Paraburkholderia sp. TaxID=1822466 RepID=UPI002593567D|nr:hypothetical protein [uncultured Paraburkholderia sp.]CAH2902317.1 MAG: hypothetical protein PCALPYG08_5960 [uncultured Paraburkholderia sp.]CAH2936676.1 MAG: hypothetical protein PCALPYG88_5760 [uncultured Paraburkholderia sp.]